MNKTKGLLLVWRWNFIQLLLVNKDSLIREVFFFIYCISSLDYTSTNWLKRKKDLFRKRTVNRLKRECRLSFDSMKSAKKIRRFKYTYKAYYQRTSGRVLLSISYKRLRKMFRSKWCYSYNWYYWDRTWSNIIHLSGKSILSIFWVKLDSGRTHCKCKQASCFPFKNWEPSASHSHSTSWRCRKEGRGKKEKKKKTALWLFLRLQKVGNLWLIWTPNFTNGYNEHMYYYN